MRIPLSECRHGGLYRILARNFSLGVYNESTKGYVGVREKFGRIYLFEEYDWDTGAPFGTVTPIEFLEMLPTDMSVEESLGTVDEETRRPVKYDKPRDEGGKGWYFVDTGEPGEIQPISVSNTPLFDWMKKKVAQYQRDEFLDEQLLKDFERGE